MFDKQNQSNEQTLRLVDRAVREYQESREWDLYQASRRRFLITGVLGGAGLALSPLEQTLALPMRPWLAQQYELMASSALKKGFWGTFFKILKIAATLMGFGGIFETISELVKAYANEQKKAKEAIENHVKEVVDKGYTKTIENPPSNSVAPTVIRTVDSPTASLFSRRGFLAHSQPATDKRFFMPSLRPDGLNGVTSFFDYNDQRSYNAKGLLAGPTTGALMHENMLKSFSEWGYQDKETLKNAVFPKGQTSFALGDFEGKYGDHDIHTGSTGATFDVFYQNSSDSKTGGLGVAEISICGLEDLSGSNKRMGIKRQVVTLDCQKGYSPETYTKLEEVIET